MYAISERDWKLFRKRIPGWQEGYMQRLSEEYAEILGGPEKASERFWTLEKRIRQDKKRPGVVIDMRRSTAVWNIAELISDGAISFDDLEGFSGDLIDAVKRICG